LGSWTFDNKKVSFYDVGEESRRNSGLRHFRKKDWMEIVKRVEIIKLVISLLLCQAAGLLASISTKPAIPSWYFSLKKPLFAPPAWVFAPVWIVLYFLMGFAAYLIWRTGWQQKSTRSALILFGIQLTLNALWTFIFFGLRSPLGGFIEIVILSVAILLTIQSFLQISRIAGLLLIPYFLWVALASGLNLSLWVLNR
jgi:benzodiazapine receptor